MHPPSLPLRLQCPPPCATACTEHGGQGTRPEVWPFRYKRRRSQYPPSGHQTGSRSEEAHPLAPAQPVALVPPRAPPTDPCCRLCGQGGFPPTRWHLRLLGRPRLAASAWQPDQSFTWALGPTDLKAAEPDRSPAPAPPHCALASAEPSLQVACIFLSQDISGGKQQQHIQAQKRNLPPVSHKTSCSYRHCSPERVRRASSRTHTNHLSEPPATGSTLPMLTVYLINT